MKNLILTLITVGLFLGVSTASDASQVSVRGTLILASNQGSSVDPALKKYSKQLKRLNFKSYKVIGSGGTRVSSGGNAVISLGKGYTVKISIRPQSGNRPAANIEWLEGRKTLIRTGGNLPLVLGGPRHGNGNLILILDGR